MESADDAVVRHPGSPGDHPGGANPGLDIPREVSASDA